MEDLNNAIETARECVDLTPKDDPQLYGLLRNLCYLYTTRFNKLHDPTDADNQIKTWEKAVATTKKDSQKWAASLVKLSILYTSRSDRLDDLEKAIKIAEEAASPALEGMPVQDICLSNLSDLYSSRFHRLGDSRDIDNAILFGERGLMISTDPLERSGRLSRLSEKYHSRFRRCMDLLDLDKAIKKAVQALDLTRSSADKGPRLGNLSTLYGDRFHLLGALEDLEKSIETAEQAIRILPRGDRNWAVCLSNLSNRYSDRFKRVGFSVDLDNAVERAEMAVVYTLPDSDQARHLSNLSNRYISRFERRRKLNDFEKAFETAEKAVDIVPENDPDRARYLNNLSLRYGCRFVMQRNPTKLKESIEDLKKSIEFGEQSIAITPETHPTRSLRLCNLATHYKLRFNNLKPRDLVDLEKAITVTEEAVNATVQDSPDRAGILNNLSLHYQARFKQLGDKLDLKRAIDAMKKAFDQTNRSPLSRIAAGISLSRLYIRAQNDEGAATAASDAVLLLPRISPKSISRQDHEFQLSRSNGLASAACTLALVAGWSPLEAFKLLELGRGVISGLAINFQYDLSILKERDNELYKGYTALRHEISVIGGVGEAGVGEESTAKRIQRNYLDIERDLENAEAKIRELPGFDDFQLPPRMWWIMSGIMSCAPLHAAGMYDDGPEDTAMDFVISSYIHTVKALKYAREKISKQTEKEEKKALLIAASDLLGFEDEIANIRPILGEHFTTAFIKDESKETVLKDLEQSSIIHFACHGCSVGFDPSSDPPKSPSDSYLLIKTDCERKDWKKLTIEDLIKVNQPKAELAYLSACCTAQNSAVKLTDEMIHIANAFQLAGYPNVVGTLWEAQNVSAKAMATDFYKILLDGSSHDSKLNGIAIALHQAMQNLRHDKAWKSQFLAWTPFIHIGA
ncbi:hypothetical protein ABW20_dc0104803 [Dactylellina cionopaga]|nr:hypothetical protein ABW20_dc0104803 [Dactylellina cionopaga]